MSKSHRLKFVSAPFLLVFLLVNIGLTSDSTAVYQEIQPVGEVVLEEEAEATPTRKY